MAEENLGEGEVGEGRRVEEGEGRQGSKWKKMLNHDCNKKEPERRRAIRPAAVIRFHLNP